LIKSQVKPKRYVVIIFIEFFGTFLSN